VKLTKFKDIPQFTDCGNYHADYPIDRLVSYIESEQEEMGLQLNPDFQRGQVWTEAQQVAFVEILLRGGRSGRDLYLNCPSWRIQVPAGAYNDYVCVDGLQRITAISRFIHDEIKVFGSYFSEYTDKLHLLHCTMRVHVNDLRTRHDVLNWYLEMNSGGTPHSKEELQRIQDLLDNCAHPLFSVVFVRKDGKPNEVYQWHTPEEALAHLELFKDDDSDLYKEIYAINEETGERIAGIF